MVVTHSADLSADLVIRHLLANNLPYYRLNTDELGTASCSFGYSSGPLLNTPSRTIRPSEVSAAWIRRFAPAKILQDIPIENQEFVRRELATVLDAFIEAIPLKRQVNSFQADRAAGNRLLQMQRAARIGFNIPETLVTQNVEEARHFVASWPSVVTKAISFGRTSQKDSGNLFSHTSAVTLSADFSGLSCCPSMFQAEIPKRYDWRVTTVGNKFFSARLEADPGAPIDWRAQPRAATSFVAASPPGEVVEKLMSLCAESGIIYGAHDLIETQQDDFVFLETNPAGQWGWLELTIGLPIGRAIALELARLL